MSERDEVQVLVATLDATTASMLQVYADLEARYGPDRARELWRLACDEYDRKHAEAGNDRILGRLDSVVDDPR